MAAGRCCLIPVIATFVFGGFFAWAPASATETPFEFSAPVLNDTSYLATGNRMGEVRVAGKLSLPTGAAGPVPAVIIAHTIGGPTHADIDIADALTDAGFATLRYDSFAPRAAYFSIRQADGAKGALNQTADAIMALKSLAADPRIDGRRIAVLGMSSGGSAAITTMTKWVVETVLNPVDAMSFAPVAPKDGGLRFAAHVAFYPAMHWPPPAEDISSAPLLLIVGDRDNWQRAERDVAWANYIGRNSKAAHIEIKLLPAVYHDFLNSSIPGYLIARDAYTAATCPLRLATPLGKTLWLDGTVHASVEIPPGDCTRKGLLAGYSSEAAHQSLQLTIDFLRRSFAEASK